MNIQIVLFTSLLFLPFKVFSSGITNNLKIFDLLMKNEKQIRTTRNHFGEKEFILKKGSLPILLTAPHAAKHKRKNLFKPPEPFTSSIALTLNKLSDCFVLYLKHKVNYDPNYDKINPFKKKIFEIINTYNIKLILDIHDCKGDNYNPDDMAMALSGFSSNMHSFKKYLKEDLNLKKEKRNFDIDLGTSNGTSVVFKEFLLEELKTDLINAGFIVSKDYFSAEGNTITMYAISELDIPAIQIEINKDRMYLKNNTNKYDEKSMAKTVLLIKVLSKYINRINKM